MNWSEFSSIPTGTRVYNHGYDQCVGLVNLYHESVIGGSFVPVNSAYQWWTDFNRYKTLTDNYSRSQTPRAGAIVVSRYGRYNAPHGHIGVVLSVNSNGTFNTLEQNAEKNRYVARYTRNMANILGFLVPKRSPIPSSKGKPLAYYSRAKVRSNSKRLQSIPPGRRTFLHINDKGDVSVLNERGGMLRGTISTTHTIHVRGTPGDRFALGAVRGLWSKAAGWRQSAWLESVNGEINADGEEKIQLNIKNFIPGMQRLRFYIHSMSDAKPITVVRSSTKGLRW